METQPRPLPDLIAYSGPVIEMIHWMQMSVKKMIGIELSKIYTGI